MVDRRLLGYVGATWLAAMTGVTATVYVGATSEFPEFLGTTYVVGGATFLLLFQFLVAPEQ